MPFGLQEYCVLCVSFVSFLGEPLSEELQGSVDSPQETGALQAPNAREQILISACSGLLTLRGTWV